MTRSPTVRRERISRSERIIWLALALCCPLYGTFVLLSMDIFAAGWGGGPQSLPRGSATASAREVPRASHAPPARGRGVVGRSGGANFPRHRPNRQWTQRRYRIARNPSSTAPAAAAVVKGCSNRSNAAALFRAERGFSNTEPKCLRGTAVATNFNDRQFVREKTREKWKTSSKTAMRSPR
jgi:hypothetical protein